MGTAAVDASAAGLSEGVKFADGSALAELCRRVGRLVFWLRAFALFLALMVIAPVQAAVLTAPRIAVAGGLLLAASGITMLIRRSRLLPARAYAFAGMIAATAAVCELFIASPNGAGSGSQWSGVFFALLLAFPAVIMNRRFARRCAAAGFTPGRVVEAARIPPLTGVRGVRHLRVRLGLWTPVLLLIQLVTSAALLCVSAFNTLVTPLPFGGWIGKVLDLAYGRTRHDLHDRIGRVGAYRGSPHLAVFAGPTADDAKIKVRSDALRWGECLPHNVHFSEYLIEQLWLYGVPCLVHGVSERAWSPSGVSQDLSTPAGLVLLVEPGTRGPTADELNGYAPKALLVLPPGQDARTVRAELARVAPRLAARLGVSDEQLQSVLAVTVDGTGAITVHIAGDKSQWTYMAALDAAVRELELRKAPDGAPAAPLTTSLGASASTVSNATRAEPAAHSRRLSAKALTAILLGGWGIIVITANNRPHPRGDNYSELVIGMVMAAIALMCALWATADMLRDLRLPRAVLALIGLAAACVSTVLGIAALSG